MIRLLVICACLCIAFTAKAHVTPRVLLKLSVETKDGEKAEGYVLTYLDAGFFDNYLECNNQLFPFGKAINRVGSYASDIDPHLATLVHVDTLKLYENVIRMNVKDEGNVYSCVGEYSKILTKNIVNFTLQEAKVQAYLYFETELNANDLGTIPEGEIELHQMGEIELCNYSIVYLQSPTKKMNAKVSSFQRFLSENGAEIPNYEIYNRKFELYLKDLKALNILVLSFCSC